MAFLDLAGGLPRTVLDRIRPILNGRGQTALIAGAALAAAVIDVGQPRPVTQVPHPTSLPTYLIRRARARRNSIGRAAVLCPINVGTAVLGPSTKLTWVVDGAAGVPLWLGCLRRHAERAAQAETLPARSTVTPASRSAKSPTSCASAGLRPRRSHRPCFCDFPARSPVPHHWDVNSPYAVFIFSVRPAVEGVPAAKGSPYRWGKSPRGGVISS